VSSEGIEGKDDGTPVAIPVGNLSGVVVGMTAAENAAGVASSWSGGVVLSPIGMSSCSFVKGEGWAPYDPPICGSEVASGYIVFVEGVDSAAYPPPTCGSGAAYESIVGSLEDVPKFVKFVGSTAAGLLGRPVAIAEESPGTVTVTGGAVTVTIWVMILVNASKKIRIELV
jgi:hypothetical protein